MTTTREAPQDVAEAITAARLLDHEGRERIKRAANMIRVAAEELERQGWNQNQIAEALSVSRQRVSQLFKAPRKK
jgi:predicted XRE-type DNA-binding protein